jgi:hypothetical protein
MPMAYMDAIVARQGNIDSYVLWSYMCKHEKGTAKSVTMIKDDVLMRKAVNDAVKRYIKSDKGGAKPSDAKGKGKGKGKGKSKGKSNGKDMGSFSAVQIAQPEAFTMPDGGIAPRINMDFFDHNSTGIGFGLATNIGPKILAFDGQHSPKPLAMIINCELKALENMDKKGRIYGAYQCEQIDLAVTFKEGDPPIPRKAVPINLGHRAIQYQPCTRAVTPTKTLYTTIASI